MRRSRKTVTRNKNSDEKKLVAELQSARRLAGLLSCCAQSRRISERAVAAKRDRQRRPLRKCESEVGTPRKTTEKLLSYRPSSVAPRCSAQAGHYTVTDKEREKQRRRQPR